MVWKAPSSPSGYDEAVKTLNGQLHLLGLSAIAELRARRESERAALPTLDEEASKRVLADGSPRGGGDASGTGKKAKKGRSNKAA